MADFEDGREPQTKEYQKPIEAEKGKKTDFHQKSPRRMQSHQHLGPVKPILDFRPVKL